MNYTPFTLNQKVWLDIQNLRMKINSKLKPRREGPFSSNVVSPPPTETGSTHPRSVATPLRCSHSNSYLHLQPEQCRCHSPPPPSIPNNSIDLHPTRFLHPLSSLTNLPHPDHNHHLLLLLPLLEAQTSSTCPLSPPQAEPLPSLGNTTRLLCLLVLEIALYDKSVCSFTIHQNRCDAHRRDSAHSAKICMQIFARAKQAKKDNHPTAAKPPKQNSN